MKKQIRITLLCTLFYLPLIAQDSKMNLVVQGKDGTKVAYAINDKPKITYVNKELVINTNEIDVNYPLAKLERLYYEYQDETSVENIINNEKNFKISAGTLLFSELKANSVISLISVNGSVIFKKKIPKDGNYAFPIDNLNTGVYLVNIDGLTYKIAIK